LKDPANFLPEHGPKDCWCSQWRQEKEAAAVELQQETTSSSSQQILKADSVEDAWLPTSTFLLKALEVSDSMEKLHKPESGRHP
jgi:hypothetical protein